MNSYQKIVQLSNFFYNEGLERAQVHNMSGAIESLRRSLHYNKNHINARNLLGLVYYEVGESVMALREWVISENIQSEGNDATRYIKEIQPEMARTGKLNQCVKKYNMALEYAHSDSEDLAIIQLKKVTSMNPKFVRAHLLLALLYLHQEQYGLAKEVLRKAGRVDANNTTLLRYLKEANEHLHVDPKKSKKKNVSEDTVAYTSGNDTIIKPAHIRDNATIGTIVNIIFGLVVGFLISFFLVVPGVKQRASADSAAKLVEANNTISTKNLAIREYQKTIDELEDQIQKAENNSSKSETTMAFYKQLLETYVSYIEGDYEKAGKALEEIHDNDVAKDFKETYDTLKQQVNEKYLNMIYSDASSNYNQGMYEEAIVLFEKILKIDENYSDGNAMYYCAQAYRKNGDNQKAIVLYQKVIDNYPDTYKASNSQKQLDRIKNN